MQKLELMDLGCLNLKFHQGVNHCFLLLRPFSLKEALGEEADTLLKSSNKETNSPLAAWLSRPFIERAPVATCCGESTVRESDDPINEFPLEQISHRMTRGSSCAVHLKDFGQLTEREPYPLGQGYPLEVSHVMRVPHAVPARRTLRFGQDSDSLIVADTVRANARDTRNLADLQFLRRHPPASQHNPHSRGLNRIQGQELLTDFVPLPCAFILLRTM